MWRLRACLKKRTQLWEITQLDERHTCVNIDVHQDHVQLDANMLAREIQPIIEVDQGISIKALIEIIKARYDNHEVNYKRMWDAKKKAIASAFGDWDSSYAKLPRWLAIVKMRNPGTKFEWSHRQWDAYEIRTPYP